MGRPEESVGLRRFLSPRFAVSGRLRQAHLDLGLQHESLFRFEDLGTGEVFESLFDHEIDGVSDMFDVEVSAEFHPRSDAKLDPYLGLSVASVYFQGESAEEAVESIDGGVGLGATLGLDINLGSGRSFLSIAARFSSLSAEPQLSDRLTLRDDTTVIVDDDLALTTLEIGLGVRFGSRKP